MSLGAAKRVTNDPYDVAQRLLAATTGREIGYSQLIADQPTTVGPERWETLVQAGQTIQEYFRASLRLFKAHLEHPSSSPTVVAAALADAPAHLGLDYHRQLAAPLLSAPIFFRTDESRFGHILELQCPGSLWGDHILLQQVYEERGCDLKGNPGSNLAANFAAVAREVCGGEAVIHHLLDNASAPSTMRHFVAMTAGQQGIKYYGWSDGVGARDCNLIRSHSVYGLVAENFFRYRQAKAVEERLLFDLPSHLLFDQKLCLTWPFMPDTRAHYSDHVRGLFAFSSLVVDGFVVLPEDEGGTVSINDFAKRPRRERNYFLKYAGTDVALNWGSQAVHSLSRLGMEACREKLAGASDDTAQGRPWLIQRGDEVREDATWFGKVPGSAQLAHGECSLKVSRFFGRERLLGALAQHRNFYKVHGQNDTCNSIVVE